MKREPLLVVVTGAGSGIGRASAAHYARKGATAIVSDVDLAGAEAAVADIVAQGGKAVAYQLDVSDAAAMRTFAEWVRAEHGVADVLVNSAGFAFGGSFMQHTEADWKRLMGVNLMGTVYASRYFGEQMIERGDGGHIVNIASLGAYTPSSALVSYCTSKASVRMVSECLRAELAAHDIGVSVICPGAIKTNIYAATRHLGVDDEQAERRSEALGKLIKLAPAPGPDLVARVIDRAVRHNWGIVPVRPEAWLAYAGSRVSPGLMRTGARWVTGEQMTALADRAASTRIARRLLGAGKASG